MRDDAAGTPARSASAVWSVERTLIFTRAGTFKVECSADEALRRLGAEEWPMFVLTDGQESVFIRSSEVCGVQELRPLRGSVGFQPS